MNNAATFQDAYRAFQAGDFARCAEILAPALDTEKADNATLLIAAQCHSKLNNGKTAGELYTRLAEAQPSNKATFLKLAEEAAAKGDARESREDQPLTAGFIDQLLSNAPVPDMRTAEIIGLYRKAAFADAAEKFENLLADRTISDPAIATVAMIGYCNMHAGNLEKAAHYLAHAGLSPSLHQTHLLNAALELFQTLLVEKNLIPEIGYEAVKRLATLEPQNTKAVIYHRYTMHMTCAIDDLRSFNAIARAGLERGDTLFTKMKSCTATCSGVPMKGLTLSSTIVQLFPPSPRRPATSAADGNTHSRIKFASVISPPTFMRSTPPAFCSKAFLPLMILRNLKSPSTVSPRAISARKTLHSERPCPGSYP